MGVGSKEYKLMKKVTCIVKGRKCEREGSGWIREGREGGRSEGVRERERD